MAIADLSRVRRRPLFLVALFAASCIAATQKNASCLLQQQEDAHVIAPLIIIKYPPDGTVISDYRGGGKGHEMSLGYEVEHLPCGGASQIFINGNVIGFHFKDNVLGFHFRDTVVDRVLWLTPGHYQIEVVVEDDGGKEQSRQGVSVEVELPAYAQQVRVFGTHDTLSAILDALGSNESGAFLRFGDGDIQIASSRDDQMQAADAALTREVQVLVRYFSTGS
jgi:hypothetical protein